MRKYAPLVLGLLLLSVRPIAAQPAEGKLIEDAWEVVQLGGYRVGHVHISTHEIENKNGKVLQTRVAQELGLKRGNAVQTLAAEQGTSETPDGKVVGVAMRWEQTNQKGTVEAKGLHLIVNDGQIDKYVPWNNKVIGFYQQFHIYKDRKVKAGDTFTYQSYEPTLTTVVTVHVTVSEAEEVRTLKGKQKLLRVDLVTDPIEVPKPGTDEKFKLQLPKLTAWLDKDFTPIRRQTDFPGIGTVVLQRTDRATATAPLEAVPDILDNTSVPLNRTIANAYRTRHVVFRVTVKDDDDPTTTLAQDGRQEIKNAKGASFELHVQAVRSPIKVEKPDAAAKEEFLKSNFYLKSDDAKVKSLAETAVGEETDPLKKARRIERWVYENMQNDNRVQAMSADRIARELKGDCRQHAMLTAAMCRAAGVPSRTAVGLVYIVDKHGRPVMAYHMWTEVWVQGQWLAIDATRGEGSIDAVHVKIADQSWYDTHSLTPLLAVARVLDKLNIEVVSATVAVFG